MSRQIAAALLAALPLAAQEAINTNAATQPGVGRVVVREQVRSYAAKGPGAAPLAGAELQLVSSAYVGLRHDVALGLEVPFRYLRPDAGGDEADFGDVRLVGKWRFHRADTGPIDTERASLLAGVSMDTGEGPSLRPGFASGSTDAVLGAVYTRVHGRHGLNFAAEANLTTGSSADAFRGDAAWLYRLAPAAFTADSGAAWYLVAELNGYAEANGDQELFVAPGLLYEARRWTAELSFQLPLAQELDHRPEIDFGVVLGLRLLF